MELISVKVQQLNAPNKNGHTYTDKSFAQSIANFQLGTNQIFGRLGMPISNTIDLDRVSHQITDLRIEDNYLVANIKILDTPNGRILERLLKSDSIIAEQAIVPTFRPKGLGVLTPVGETNEVTEYELISIDIVDDPV